MKTKTNNYLKVFLISKLWILVILAISVLFVESYCWQGRSWQNIISSDGKRYYAYLPALFINSNLIKTDKNTNYLNEINKKNECQYYYSFLINDFPEHKLKSWRTYYYSFNIPKLKALNDKFLIYIWNKEKQNFIIDDFKLDFYRIY